MLERVAIPFSRRSSQPRDLTQVSCTADRFFAIWATREAHAMIKSLCCGENPMSNTEGAWLRQDYLKMGAQNTESQVSELEAGETKYGIALRNTRGPRTGSWAGIPLRNNCREKVRQPHPSAGLGELWLCWWYPTMTASRPKTHGWALTLRWSAKIPAHSPASAAHAGHSGSVPQAADGFICQRFL